uniref:Chloride channel protein n=1 Tax=Leptocylindrus danicus TaxID=163516 RepID=A0A7S2KZS1_9STRA|mmetsp:Transcript_29426/g.43212  ORF Transcript_29426/g.43212 Transcript_29426/m.43212 type:complete len:1168 (+) Transcript_29426:131-3634(+)|eukprot:CAMPEP_0116011630 /NCGR_PEP_ID=MMETSP0321-20121206/4674_1 /TAXON_ID=163516 /ORGANISM="Leptocylindrus danicus var. danicus, Strain B650" /LENGTH=1167 /DNA_ID=CAMNT_0003480883 /DNA_START=130 /DNA_END=3633 /DNA_ORIENTATION=+
MDYGATGNSNVRPPRLPRQQPPPNARPESSNDQRRHNYAAQNAPPATSKKVIATGRHRNDSWGGMSNLTRNAIFDGQQFELDISPFQNQHPLKRGMAPLPSARGNSTSSGSGNNVPAPRVPIPRARPPSQSNARRSYNAPQAASSDSSNEVTFQQQPKSSKKKASANDSRWTRGASMFTIQSHDEDDDWHRQSSASKSNVWDNWESGDLEGGSRSPTKAKEESNGGRVSTWLGKIIGSDPDTQVKNKTEDTVNESNSSMMNVDEFARLARGDVPVPVTVDSSLDGDEELPLYAEPTERYLSRFLNKCLTWISEFMRAFFYDPMFPEFTSLQLSVWAGVLGVFFGMFTAYWGMIIDKCVEFVWVTLPARLLEDGWFTDLDGSFPLPHYMWITPTIFGGILAAVTVVLPVPIPGQNEWIENLHKYGVMEYDSFLYVLVISTLGMASGMSLGPELPLVLLSGMIGSQLAIMTRQSILCARVLTLTAGSAAIGGFFGFPMAGALFVLEVPHRLGVQYYEAISPSIFSSIIAVLVNRMVTKDEVKGYFSYPFLEDNLPSHIFYIALLYGVIGSIVGTGYARGAFKLKMTVHDLFHVHDHHDHGHGHGARHDAASDISSLPGVDTEDEPLVGKKVIIKVPDEPNSPYERFLAFVNKREWVRCYILGTIAGFATGMFCMFFPHALFWGESQLQSLIDRGRTPLPFITESEVADLTAFGYCMVDPTAVPHEEYSTACNGILAVVKVIVTGISLGTGIVGGQFWGPLFVGAAASYCITDILGMIYDYSGLAFFQVVSQYPCVALLCIMGSTHVVTFRAHTAIMLILTLTISSFSEEGVDTSGDYSAVFPLLVVACFISLMCTRSTVFYAKQRSRGDIIATPENLCEPMKHGEVEFPRAEGMVYDSDMCTSSSYKEDDDDESSTSTEYELAEVVVGTNKIPSERSMLSKSKRYADERSSPSSLEADMSVSLNRPSDETSLSQRDGTDSASLSPRRNFSNSSNLSERGKIIPKSSNFHRRTRSDGGHNLTRPGMFDRRSTFKRSGSFDKSRSRLNSKDSDSIHYSNGGANLGLRERVSSRDYSRPDTPDSQTMMKVTSYGEVKFEPDLMDQARNRAATRHSQRNLIPRSGRNSRPSSNKSSMNQSTFADTAGALTPEDIERAFVNTQNQYHLAGLSSN